MKYEMILFDVDDTLFDFGKSEKSALQLAFDEFGLPTGAADYADQYKEISKELWRDLEQGLTSLPELGAERFRRLFLAQQLEIEADLFNARYLGYLGKEISLVDGAVEICEHLAGCRMAVITNGFNDVQKSRIGGSPLCNTFEQIITSEEAGCQKPERGIFDYAFSKLQITDKTKVLMVGDSLTSDIQGGINYGIDTCWFNPDAKENHSGVQPTYEIRRLTDLISLLE
ncbi:YjjG family noncanonical pyrimidine nucleotidase [Bhargavaea cecembensis]|uniref:YjjG family noncanonical pyrimidine nucleotidase n=1 Tax=Bhargavaea cecembensis TaxID=394098 RepID=UPI00058B53E8|nr:YjjG family noncanonical pyrimidine nucleotidase [Bhargavaea cecembensis]